ncbi:energy transducer TonB [Flavobacterium sp. 3HN19-14]|uniref:energy transducer TonB n=1 Tax=Flavobacterium sp. 3HN19-14 TaxID=3448133 RepID=UPI003EE40A1A
MKKILVFAFFFISFIGYSQEAGDADDVHPSDVIEPKFNGGGIDKFYDYIKANFDFSKVTKKGNITASFTINEEEELTNIRIVKVLDDASAMEFIRVLQNAPKWESAKRGGKPFSVTIKIPLDFK